MKLKHLATSLNATFESFVTSIENHEAVATSMIQDISRAAARLRMQNNRVHARIKTLEKSQRTLQVQADTWQTRAQTRSLKNPDQARQCLQQRDATRKRLVHVTRELSESMELQNELADHLQQIEQRLSELKSRRVALASREAFTGAIARSETDEPYSDIDGLFDRWEEAVLQNQYKHTGRNQPAGASFTDSSNPTSELAHELDQEEYNEAIEKELKQLQELQKDQK